MKCVRTIAVVIAFASVYSISHANDDTIEVRIRQVEARERAVELRENAVRIREIQLRDWVVHAQLWVDAIRAKYEPKATPQSDTTAQPNVVVSQAIVPVQMGSTCINGQCYRKGVSYGGW